MSLNPAIEPSKTARLFGILNSNRDFSQTKNWGKNIFNNAFPVSLCCYMHSKGLTPVYFTLNEQLRLNKTYIPVEGLFGLAPTSPNIYFAFESDFSPYQPLVINNLPRADIVVMDANNGVSVSNFEIKLTTLPDNSTARLTDERYGCEIVVRPDTIVYMALSIASQLKSDSTKLLQAFVPLNVITDWTDVEQVAPMIPQMSKILDAFMLENLHLQQPLLLQPIWKTEGKRLILHQNAFDVFVWSDFAFTRLFFRDANLNHGTIQRGTRSIAWLTKMLLDFALEGQFNHAKIVRSMSLLGPRPDKAFAVNGLVTYPFMKSEELIQPRVKREEVKNIIRSYAVEFAGKGLKPLVQAENPVQVRKS